MTFEVLWMSGVIMAFVSFGIKTGLGLGMNLFTAGTKRPAGWGFAAGTLMTYMVLFLCIHLVVTRLNLIHYLDQLTGLMQYGMLVHLAVASGLMIWGVKLLAERPKMKQATRISAGLFLVMPCPVCATVILLNLTLALSLSALAPVITTLTLFTLFFAIVAVTWLMLVFGFRHKEIDNLFLGAAMVLIALYFLLTVLIAPIYPKLKPAFAMAVSNNPFRDIDPFPMVIFGCTALSLFGIGFIRKYVNKGV